MSDVKHARGAEAYLQEVKDAQQADPIDVAVVHAQLAISRAAREMDTTIRIGFKDLSERVKGPPAAQLVLLEQQSGHVWLNARQIVSIKADDEYPEKTAVRMTDGMIYLIQSNVVDTSATIFQVVGSW